MKGAPVIWGFLLLAIAVQMQFCSILNNKWDQFKPQLNRVCYIKMLHTH